VYYSGSNDQRQFGTGFLIHKKYKNLSLDFSLEMDKICSLQKKGKFFNTTMICSHAPTGEKDEVQKDAFYKKIYIYMKVPKHNIKTVIGDFNAKVGEEHGLIPNVGKYTLHEETNNGWRMTDFAMARNMAISSTLIIIILDSLPPTNL
jgi:hypothetical protein